MEYEAHGETVSIPALINPFTVLGISPTESPGDTNMALRRELSKSKRQDRALASLAYHMITSPTKYLRKQNTYQIKNLDIFVLAAMGHKDMIAAKIAENASLVNSVDECKRTILYIAACGGFGDIVELLLQKEADVNHKQYKNSTPLHVAAFNGQSDIIRMLLVYGADPTFKNDFGNTPYHESSGKAIQIFEEFRKEPVMSAQQHFFQILKAMRVVYIPGKKIGYEVFRPPLDYHTKVKWDDIGRHWEVAYHGTRLRCVQSILSNGLIPSGSSLPSGEIIKPPPHHKSMDATHENISKWAQAIFVSPSIMYASHPAYSEYCGKGDSQWCVVLKVYVEPSAYKEYMSTTRVKHDPIEGEPNCPEYRIDKPEKRDLTGLTKMHQFCINIGRLASEVSRNVVVASVLFLKTSFREDVKKKGLTFNELHANLR